MAKISNDTKETTVELTGKFTHGFRKIIADKTATKDNDAKFTGKVKTVKSDLKTASKIKPLKQGNELIDMLMKIYTFMNKNFDDDKTRLEEENNFKEEQKIEDEKRHQKLIKAIETLTKSLGVGTETATKADTTPTHGIMDVLGDAADIISTVTKLAPLAAIAGTLVTMVAAGYAGKTLSEYLNKRGEENEAKDAELIKAPLDTKALEGLNDADSIVITSDKRRQQALIEKRIDAGQKFTPEESALIKKKFDIDVPVDNGGKNVESTPQEKKLLENMIKKDPEGTLAQKYYSEHPNDEITKKYKKATPAPAPVSTAPTSAATPTASPPPSAKLNTVQAENNVAKVDEMSTPSTPTINNVTATSNAQKPPPNQRKSIPPVRNLEETFQKMIVYSTRVV